MALDLYPNFFANLFLCFSFYFRLSWPAYWSTFWYR